MACWADMRVADETTQMGVFCRRWGVPLIDGGTQRLPALIGLSAALDLILTGRFVIVLFYSVENRFTSCHKCCL